MDSFYPQQQLVTLARGISTYLRVYNSQLYVWILNNWHDIENILENSEAITSVSKVFAHEYVLDEYDIFYNQPAIGNFLFISNQTYFIFL